MKHISNTILRPIIDIRALIKVILDVGRTYGITYARLDEPNSSRDKTYVSIELMGENEHESKYYYLDIDCADKEYLSINMIDEDGKSFTKKPYEIVTWASLLEFEQILEGLFEMI